MPNASRHHPRSSHHGGNGEGGGGRSKRHYSTSSGTDRDRSLRSAAAASKRSSAKNSSRTAREKQIMTTRVDSSDSSDVEGGGRTKQNYGEATLSRRRNSKDNLLKKSAAAATQSSPREHRSNRSGESPRPRSNSSGKDRSSAEVKAVGGKSSSPRRDLAKTEDAPPLPPKGVKKGAAEAANKLHSSNGESRRESPLVTQPKSAPPFFKEELDFTSSRLESETNKMRFIEEIHRRQERERLRDHAQQQQDRLARELTTTFKLTAGKRLTAKAREMSKSQGDGIDDVATAAVGAVSEQVRISSLRASGRRNDHQKRMKYQMHENKCVW